MRFPNLFTPPAVLESIKGRAIDRMEFELQKAAPDLYARLFYKGPKLEFVESNQDLITRLYSFAIFHEEIKEAAHVAHIDGLRQFFSKVINGPCLNIENVRSSQ